MCVRRLHNVRQKLKSVAACGQLYGMNLILMIVGCIQRQHRLRMLLFSAAMAFAKVLTPQPSQKQWSAICPEIYNCTVT